MKHQQSCENFWLAVCSSGHQVLTEKFRWATRKPAASLASPTPATTHMQCLTRVHMITRMHAGPFNLPLTIHANSIRIRSWTPYYYWLAQKSATQTWRSTKIEYTQDTGTEISTRAWRPISSRSRSRATRDSIGLAMSPFQVTGQIRAS